MEQKVRGLIVKWRDILRLYNWRIKYRFVDKLGIESRFGNILIEPDILRATIEIMYSCPEEELENLIVHELVHLCLYSLVAYCNHFIEEFFGIRERKMLVKMLREKEENITENLAQTLIDVENRNENK